MRSPENSQKSSPPAMGHSGTLTNGAKASANLYSLVSCARVNGVEPYAYLLYLLEELPKANTAEALELLLPWSVKPVLQIRRVSA